MAFLVIASGCARPLHRFEYTEIIMGVDARVTLFARHEDEARHAARAAFDRMNDLDGVLSDYRQDSEAMRLCRAHGRPIAVSDDLYDALERSIEISRQTGGLFDVTIGPIVQLWRQARRDRRLPAAEALDEARERVGFQLIGLDPPARTATLGRADMRLDFGGIGKGLASQEALEILVERGIERCLIDLGGDIAAGAPPPGAGHWRVEVDTGAGSPVLVVPLAHSAIATSGFSEQFVDIEGVRYSHIIDPRTGMGLTNRTAVCVIGPDGATADALASALSVLGREGAAQLMAQFPGCAAMLEVEMDDAPLRIYLNEFPALPER
jgi:thiamine biosynthesis lipoprotein